MSNKVKKTLVLTVRGLFLTIILACTVIPFIWVIISSFKTNDEILTSALSLPQSWTFEAYTRAFSLAPINVFFRNSLIVSITTTGLAVLIFGMGGYALARAEGKLVKAIVVMISLSLYIPVSALVQPVFLVVQGLGMYNQLSGLVLVNLSMSLAVSVFVLRAAFMAIPIEIEESAYMDGAGIPKTFFLIVLPMASSGLVTASILCFISSWNQFLFPLILTSQESNFTLPLAINYFTASFRFDYPALFAALTITILPTIIVFFLLSDKIIAGMASGAIKG